MKIKISFLLALLSMLVLSGCATGFKAIYDHDPAKDFSTYRTFAWISDHPMKVGEGVGVTNPLLEPRIMSAVESTLAARGYEKVAETENADFVLSFTVGSRE